MEDKVEEFRQQKWALMAITQDGVQNWDDDVETAGGLGGHVIGVNDCFACSSA